MKCEGFGYITNLEDYLENNRLIAYYCGFDITKKFPSYRTCDRFCGNWITAFLRKSCRHRSSSCMSWASWMHPLSDWIPRLSWKTLNRTTQNPLQKTSSPRKTTPKATQTAPSASTPLLISTMNVSMSFIGAIKTMC